MSKKQSTKAAEAVAAADAAQDVPTPSPVAAAIAEVVTPAPEAKKVNLALRGSSTVASPVARVWMLCEAMFAAAKAAGQPHPRRKDVVTEGMKLGIAYYTVRTQYQAWFRFTNSGTNLISAQASAPEGLSRNLAAAFFPPAQPTS